MRAEASAKALRVPIIGPPPRGDGASGAIARALGPGLLGARGARMANISLQFFPCWLPFEEGF